MTRQEVLNILRAHMPEIKKRFGVKRLGIFGSVARNEATEGSDVDIIVEFEEGSYTYKNFMALYDYLEKLLGISIDLLTAQAVENIRYTEIKDAIKRETVYVYTGR
jgi:hypothetical protein